VLIEVICGKPALDDALPTQKMNLALWELSCNKKGTFHAMMDPYLIGKVNMNSLNKVLELAWKCLEERRENVLCQLEEALYLELASHVSNENDNDNGDILDVRFLHVIKLFTRKYNRIVSAGSCVFHKCFRNIHQVKCLGINCLFV